MSQQILVQHISPDATIKSATKWTIWKTQGQNIGREEYLSVLGCGHSARLNGWTRFKVSLALVILLFAWRQQLAFGPDTHYLSTNERLTRNDLVSSNKALKSVTKQPRQNNILTKSQYHFCSGVTLEFFPLLSPRSHCNTEHAGEVAVVQRK